MKQCAARQFENELVERLSILANRHLRPPAPERGPHSIPMTGTTSIVDFYALPTLVPVSRTALYKYISRV